MASPFLTSALVEDEWLASRPQPLYPRKRAIGTHWIGSWVGPRAGLDAMEKRKISFSCRRSNPGRPARSPSLYRLSYPGSYVDEYKFLADWQCHMVQGTNFQPAVSILNDVPPMTRNAETRTKLKGDIRFGTQDMRRRATSIPDSGA
jgi:hypothetical protein